MSKHARILVYSLLCLVLTHRVSRSLLVTSQSLTDSLTHSLAYFLLTSWLLAAGGHDILHWLRRGTRQDGQRPSNPNPDPNPDPNPNPNPKPSPSPSPNPNPNPDRNQVNALASAPSSENAYRADDIQQLMAHFAT